MENHQAMEDHQARAVIVTCMDFRLQEAINNWISHNFQPKTFDRVAVAGGVKDLKTILSQVDIAVKLHHIKKVVLVNHEDCGAYGKAGTLQKHTADLQLTKTKVKEIYPNLEVNTYYLHLDGTFDSIAS